MQAFVPTTGVGPRLASYSRPRIAVAPVYRSDLLTARRTKVAMIGDYNSRVKAESPVTGISARMQAGTFASSSSAVPEPVTSLGGGSSGGFSGGGGGSGSGGGGGSSDGASGDAGGDEATLAALLTKMKMTMADLPADVRRAYEAGLIGADVLVNFLLAKANWLSRILMTAGPGMRNRFLADRFFLLKILIEEGMGIAGKLGAEYERRRDNFFKEGEFVVANLITALLADFALVYLPAPSVALEKTGAGTSWLKRIATELPSNIFQTDRPFTLGQRAGGFLLKGGQLFTVGFACCLIGAALTNGLVYVREKVDKGYKPKTEKTNVLAVSFLYAVFLGVSSGSRYQLINGIENHIFPRIFAKSPVLLEQASTFLLRYGNTFWGSAQWVTVCSFA